jgi:[ribosomal protein S5]-alanine N-acetyltransferase
MFGFLHAKPYTVRLDGPCVYLRPPERRDQKMWTELRKMSRVFLEPWEPAWPPDATSRSAYRRRLTRLDEDWKEERACAFFILNRTSDDLLGGITVSNVRRGVAQSASIGYWIGEPHARLGYMFEAVQLTLNFCFETLNLHRVEAACLPSNDASSALLLKSGFKEEGFARKYLRINNQWQDHRTFAIIRADARPGVENLKGSTHRYA